MKLACIQFRTSADRAATLTKAAQLIGEAAAAGAKVAVLPECFTGLYGVPHFAGNAEVPLDEGSGTRMMRDAAKLHGIYVAGGVIERAGDRLHNTVFAFGPDGGEVARYRKLHLSRVTFGADATSESSVLTAGEELSCFEVAGTPFKVGLLNCFDLRFLGLSAALARAGCNVLLYPSAWLRSSGALGHWDCLLRARALDHQAFVAGVDVALDEAQDPVCYGCTCILDPLAATLAVCKDHTADEVVIAEVTEARLLEARRRIPLSEVARPEVYGLAVP